MEPPDAQEKTIRFGCGFVFGVVLVVGSSVTWSLVSHYYYLAAAVIVGVLFGLLALHYGDTFWERLSHWLWWGR